MEGKDQSQQEANPARVASYSNILPSMPQESDSQDSQAQAPPPQAEPHSHTQIPGFKEHYAQPRATHYSVEPGRMTAGGILPSSAHEHPPYAAVSQVSGTYSSLPPMGALLPPSISPVQAYPGFGSYPSPVYGYGSSGPGFSYGANSPIPNASLGVPGPQPGYGASMGAEPTFVAQGYPYYGNGYPPQYPGHAGLGYDGAPRRERGHYQEQFHPINKSYAKNPGKPIFKNENRLGPDGANLFVFHIPNEMTNYDLFQLFQSYGNVLSVRIMTEEVTGRGRGYGFVSYYSAESAALAIHHLNGLPVSTRGRKMLIIHSTSYVINSSRLYPLDTRETLEGSVQTSKTRHARPRSPALSIVCRDLAARPYKFWYLTSARLHKIVRTPSTRRFHRRTDCFRIFPDSRTSRFRK